MSWTIVIARGNLEFSAAHFITFAEDCEPLHGHNYGVRVEASGALTSNSYVLDFVALKSIVRALIKPWDHRFLLPLRNPHLRVTERDDAWELTYAPERLAPDALAPGPLRYVLPRWSVVALPVDNVTAERLAQTLAGRIVEELVARGLAATLDTLTVGIEETPMQTAFYTRTLRASQSRERSPGG